MPPRADNSVALKHHLLVYYLSLVKIKRLPMRYQVSMCLQLPIMSKVLSDSPSQRVGISNSNPLLESYIEDWQRAGPKGSEKLQAKVIKNRKV